MRTEQLEPKPLEADSDPTAEEVNEMLDTFDEEKAKRRIDVLEDMLDIMNER